MKQKIKNLVDIKFLVLVLLAMPILAAWHELGHILVGKLLGFKTYFFLTSSLVFYTKNTPCYPTCDFEEFLVNLGGPLFSWIGIILSFIGFLRNGNKRFLLGLAYMAPFYDNFLLILAVSLLGERSRLKRIDEGKIAEYINWSPLLISGIFVLIGTVVLLMCYRKIRRKKRIALVTSSVIGVLGAYILFWVIFRPYRLLDLDTLWKILSEMENGGFK